MQMTEKAIGRWEVTIKRWHPTPLNVLMRMHWAKRARILTAEYAMVGAYFRGAHVPRATGKRRVTQRLTLAGRDKERDDDGAWKGLLDALVQAEMLVDDRRNLVERNPVEYMRGTERATTIILEDME